MLRFPFVLIVTLIPTPSPLSWPWPIPGGGGEGGKFLFLIDRSETAFVLLAPTIFLCVRFRLWEGIVVGSGRKSFNQKLITLIPSLFYLFLWGFLSGEI